MAGDVSWPCFFLPAASPLIFWLQAVGPELSVFLVIDAKKGRDVKNIGIGEVASDILEFDG